MSWSNILAEYARLPDPARSLPPDVHLTSTPQTLAIFDKYPKAKYHFLVLPRYPLPNVAYGDDSATGVPGEDLDSLSALLAGDHADAVLEVLERAAEEVKEMIEDEMEAAEGFTWGVNVGFHAVESMRHVISNDLISPALKNKKHYNSFSPTHGFFLSLDTLPEPKREYEALLKEPLVSHLTGAEFSTVPKLKAHLEEEFAKLARRRRPKAAKAGEKQAGAESAAKG